ncbi:histone deacetylase family protein [Pseudoteredinibacter isoporae]|uniref:Acetoin utilization deacetylase AcuC-like enzyme n=1 Tax=Pseudoteredinibacter isoporae TaxID=570281 RepID=A0A7X0JS24_9GAMM|nr:histone deacetylase family protein [Pseudoteredinibacter isoporae]MBB6521259.1 acetoin utilization deacetylase AcuC-like enzyme [Pseudoteredinibacter isoporae]NHO86817.1 histone deacetylase family protein [Pseudoteredinibacter isoporae]NIB24731.1 histone deacetylase family protein [Pseudoteredinibacter isoporae]
MKTVFSPRHSDHWLRYEYSGGQAKPCFEKPDRVEFVKREILNRRLGSILLAEEFSLDHLCAVHDESYIRFLQECWAQWVKEMNPELDAIATVFNRQSFADHIEPRSIEARLGKYSADLTAGLGPKSWYAIEASAHVALSGAKQLLGGEKAMFSLCRPAGHHASAALMAGYCYVNNAAVAAQYCLDQGCDRVAILDIDYHHGNGTQSIFYERSEVFVASIHADPDQEYPFYAGRADECGALKGLGANLNIPLSLGTTAWPEYQTALQQSMDAIASYKPDVLIVSLGVDTYEEDPISHFRLSSDDFTKIGKQLAALDLPSLFVFEGGYAVGAIGVNTVNVLEAYSEAVMQNPSVVSL